MIHSDALAFFDIGGCPHTTEGVVLLKIECQWLLKIFECFNKAILFAIITAISQNLTLTHMYPSCTVLNLLHIVCMSTMYTITNDQCSQFEI